jgi:hypothetical protein
VFDAHPDTLWDRLMNKLNQKLALASDSAADVFRTAGTSDSIVVLT